MIKLKNPIVACIDVDDTLILWNREDYYINSAVAEQLVRHHERGHYVIVWSAGGVDWAERVVREFELDKYVNVVMAKPAFMWDDKDPKEWTRICYAKPEISMADDLRVSMLGNLNKGLYE